MAKTKRKRSGLIPFSLVRKVRLGGPLTREEFAEDMKSLERPNPNSRQTPNLKIDRDAFAKRLKEINLELPVEDLPDDIYFLMLSSEEASEMYIEAKKNFEAEIDAWQARMIEEAENSTE